MRAALARANAMVAMGNDFRGERSDVRNVSSKGERSQWLELPPAVSLHRARNEGGKTRTACLALTSAFGGVCDSLDLELFGWSHSL